MSKEFTPGTVSSLLPADVNAMIIKELKAQRPAIHAESVEPIFAVEPDGPKLIGWKVTHAKPPVRKERADKGTTRSKLGSKADSKAAT